MLIAIVVGLFVLLFAYRLSQKLVKLHPVSNKNVIVTGAGSGLGKELSLQLLALGAKIIALDIRQELLKDLMGEAERLGYGANLSTKICDVSDRSMVYQVAKEIREKYPQIHIVINNAGIVNSGKHFLELKDEQVEKVMSVNLMSHFWAAKAFLPDMIRDNQGHIVSIASVMGLMPSAYIADYVASKHALVGFHNSLRLELSQIAPGISTTLVCPALMATGMFEGLNPHKHIMPTLDHREVAKIIITAVRRRDTQVVIPYRARWMLAILALFPAAVPDAIFHFSVKKGLLKGLQFQGRGEEWNKYALQQNPKKL